MSLLLLLVAAYLLGSIPFAVVTSKLFGLADPRSYGSGNPGATNVLRSGNKLAAILTLVGDAGFDTADYSASAAGVVVDLDRAVVRAPLPARVRDAMLSRWQRYWSKQRASLPARASISLIVPSSRASSQARKCTIAAPS